MTRTRSLLLPATSVIVALTTTLTVAASSDARPGGSAGHARFTAVPAHVFATPGGGRIAVGADTTSRMLVQHYDPVTHTWDEPSLLYHRAGVTCGDVRGHSSAGGVAIILLCDSPYYDDEAPTKSVALVSDDGATWQSTVLPGEAYEAPAVSPDGHAAAWLADEIGGYVEWSDGHFLPLARTTYRYDGADPTLAVTDAGTVTVVGAAEQDGDCVVAADGRALDGTTTTQYVDHDAGCTETTFVDVDDRTVTSNDDRAHRFVISRADDDAPWTLGAPEPAQDPTLAHYPGGMNAHFSDVPGQPLVAIGSPDRHTFEAQTYDATAHAWGPARPVAEVSADGCRYDGFHVAEETHVHVVPLRCGDGSVVLLSADDVEWHRVALGRRPLSVSPHGTIVAAPGRRSTLLVTGRGVASTHRTETSRCGFVLPTRDGGLRRLHQAPGTAWPTLLQQHTARGWVTVRHVRMPTRGRCTQVRADSSGSTGTSTTFLLESGHRGPTTSLSLRVRHGRWQLVHVTY